MERLWRLSHRSRANKNSRQRTTQGTGLGSRISDFGFPSAFGFRPSDLPPPGVLIQLLQLGAAEVMLHDLFGLESL